MADFEIIERQSELEALARDLLKEKVIAVDTEADSFYHYFDKTCLVQIATKRQSFLIDPLALGGPAELAPLGPVMASPDVRTIFHAAEYDIYVLKRDCGFRFANLFDTMVSAQLLGYPQIGLAALIEHHFDVKLPKDEQRSDWSRRPLSDRQLAYAAGDVQFLIRLREKLEKELKKAGRLEWAINEFGVLCERQWPERDFNKLGYLRIKGARRLDPESLGVLRELFLMRDKRARLVDRPPFKVLGNRTLLEIAQTRPVGAQSLGQIKGVTDLILRRMAQDILRAVERGAKRSHGPIPKLEGNGKRRIDRRTERVVGLLKRWRARRAQELQIDPGVLCPNASLEAIASSKPKTASDMAKISELKGWFAHKFAGEVLAVLSGGEENDAGSQSGRSDATGESARSRSPKRR